MVSALAGFNFEGGHPAFEGLDTAGNVVSVPEFNHVVSLDYQRIELELRYTFADHWAAWLRIPYEIKDQSVEIVIPGSATPAEQAVMLRNGEIHHRDQIYSNVSDLNLLVAKGSRNWLSEGDLLVLAVGSSVPVGRTEEDPFLSADLGLQHLHLQFGTGTFDPLVELSYNRPVGTRTFLGTYIAGRFPLYANSKGYRGPPEVTASLNGRYRISGRMSLKARGIFFLQGYGQWSGERDINSGLVSVGSLLGASIALGSGIAVNTDLRLPIHQATLSGEGDSFELGPMIHVNISMLMK